jgi:hypothetical protein
MHSEYETVKNFVLVPGWVFRGLAQCGVTRHPRCLNATLGALHTTPDASPPPWGAHA